MDKRQKNQIDALSTHLKSYHILFCNFARGGVSHTEKVVGADEIDAIDYFYEVGWRVIRNKLACPDCAKARGR